MKKIYLLFAVVLFFVGGNAQIINFPDPVLKAKLLSATTNNGVAYDALGQYIVIDANNDGEIEVSEALTVYTLWLIGSQFDPEFQISDLTGISAFTNLTWITSNYTTFTSLDISSLTNLENFTCNNSQLSSLNVSGLLHLKNLALSNCQFTTMSQINFAGSPNIVNLNISNNQLATADLTSFEHLKYATFTGNNLTSINLTGLNSLEKLQVQYNQLASIDLTSLLNFKYLAISHNLLTSLDVTQNPLLDHIYGEYNLLTTLDLSQNHYFFYLNIKNNLLTSLHIKNGNNDTIELAANPNLAYICADESELGNIMLYNNTLSQVNSYCSFVPGSTYYNIQGICRFDFNGNGCDSSDILFPHVNISITNGTTTGSLISNTNGSYVIPVSTGSHTFSPILENPDYFNISPINANVTFPVTSSPFIQDFCLTANGVHNDLEILLLPGSFARPGFDNNYILRYYNKGNQTQSGSISLGFNDAILDLVTSNPTVVSQVTNSLNWNFANLAPFESREIVVTLNANSPSEIPPVNGGDILNFTASIYSSLTDETPLDNSFTLNQTVVNSFDPNDKTCLEGNAITPEMVGKEVHYMIRFENTGTANAENIVVKDMIDTAKFDVNSLIPIDGSHPFVTRISNTNKVEFIFENINLPFDDANNDGYVAFKIKTKPTLVVGDSFSNTASIYFDYNFPIVTDPAVTSVALLANSDFVFENYFSIYPNPANNVINIETKKSIKVSSINIYNTLGQVVLITPNAQQTKSVDVSSLKTGNYFLKIYSDRGSSSVKFLKL